MVVGHIIDDPSHDELIDKLFCPVPSDISEVHICEAHNDIRKIEWTRIRPIDDISRCSWDDTHIIIVAWRVVSFRTEISGDTAPTTTPTTPIKSRLGRHTEVSWPSSDCEGCTGRCRVCRCGDNLDGDTISWLDCSRERSEDSSIDTIGSSDDRYGSLCIHSGNSEGIRCIRCPEFHSSDSNKEEYIRERVSREGDSKEWKLICREGTIPSSTDRTRSDLKVGSPLIRGSKNSSHLTTIDIAHMDHDGRELSWEDEFLSRIADLIGIPDEGIPREGEPYWISCDFRSLYDPIPSTSCCEDREIIGREWYWWTTRADTEDTESSRSWEGNPRSCRSTEGDWSDCWDRSSDRISDSERCLEGLNGWRNTPLSFYSVVVDRIRKESYQEKALSRCRCSSCSGETEYSNGCSIMHRSEDTEVRRESDEHTRCSWEDTIDIRCCGDSIQYEGWSRCIPCEISCNDGEGIASRSESSQDFRPGSRSEGCEPSIHADTCDTSIVPARVGFPVTSALFTCEVTATSGRVVSGWAVIVIFRKRERERFPAVSVFQYSRIEDPTTPVFTLPELETLRFPVPSRVSLHVAPDSV